MKLSDLLERRVRDEQGNDHGVVVDVRLVQDGRPLAGPDHSLRGRRSRRRPARGPSLGSGSPGRTTPARPS